ncbi:conserved hypothetical protein [Methanohalobium evestigatum Z-7303]|uniref:Uncharacterized protein n=1 Tax=Methanohalobium evestigatum (strain ATCC BAA-1072 / DSM 3721 / NBRC 107634 / OCM 161 / Z-7303) TaxID=644295 RepID=D7E9T5_METEZ|nr:hypothetical protein [Methanohalobium evestigatum]ADI74357.1 conserved hypothetical protein [Methanohalobium evestigatum Z-7303]
MKGIAKIGISVLFVLLATMGTSMAAGGDTYSGAVEINVPEDRLGYFGEYEKGTGDDWFKFDGSGGDCAEIDLDYTFTNDYNGEMYLHDEYEGDIEAHITDSSTDRYANSLDGSWPRIEINGDWGANYEFVAGMDTDKCS